MKAKLTLFMLLIAMAVMGVYKAPAYAALASEEQMDKATKPLEEYMKDIKHSYGSIEGLLLKCNKGNLEEMLSLFHESTKASAKPLDKAAYQYLTARGYYWQSFHAFKAEKDRTIFDSVRPKIIDSYLEAFATITSIVLDDRQENAVEASNLKVHIVNTFAMLLSTNIWGGMLTDEEKKRIEEKFLNKVETTPELKALLPAALLSGVYTRLGLLEPQTEKLPDELPKDYRKVAELLYKNKSSLPAEKLMPIVRALEEQYSEAVSKDPKLQVTMAGVYVSSKDFKRAYDLYGKAAAGKHAYYLNLYILAPKLNLSTEERQQYLDKYIVGACKFKNDDTDGYDTNDAYTRVTAELFRNREYEECLRVITQAEKEKLKGTDEPIFLSGMVYYRKGRCCEILGKKEEACEAYNLAMTDMCGDPRYQYTLKEINNRIQKITSDIR